MKKPLKWLIVIIIVLLIGAGIFFVVNRNNNYKIVNNAMDFTRECLLNCPKECDSCELLNSKCVTDCFDYGQEKLGKLKWNTNPYLNDKNLIWGSCTNTCISGSNVNYDCIHNC